MTRFTIAINAGGKSTRMGTDKARVNLAGTPLIEHVLAHLSGLEPEQTLLITNCPADYAYLNLPMHSDALPGKGSLGGIYSALVASATPYTLVVACDMPFVNPVLLRYMLDLCADDAFDVIVPRTAGYPEGLHAIYSQACRAPIRTCLDADRLKVTGFYSQMRLRYLDEAEYQPLDPAGHSFFNVNTPEDLAQAERIAAQTD